MGQMVWNGTVISSYVVEKKKTLKDISDKGIQDVLLLYYNR